MNDAQPIYLSNTSTQSILQAIEPIPRQYMLIILVAEGGKPDLSSIHSAFAQSDFQYAGALFPKILYENKVHDRGLVILPIQIEGSPVTIRGLDKNQFNLQDLPASKTVKNQSLLIMLDGLSQHVAGFLRALYGHYGTNVVYLGGGAGSLSLQQSPCIFSNTGLDQDLAVVIPLSKELKLGVQHGWQRLMGPLIVTDVEDNIIKQINWQPAFEVYKDVIEKESGQSITQQNFFDVAKAYPFGLEKNDAEDIVRDPIMANDDGSLVCVGEVPENAIIHILKGEKQTLIDSARKAAETSTKQNSNELTLSIIVDCISRVLFLEQAFDDEIEQIYQSFQQHGSSTITVGALTLGEISSIGDGYLEFLNKTVVIGTLDN